MSVTAIASFIAGKDILLDGAKLVDSTFETCRFVYQGGKFPLIKGCRFVNCRFCLEGPEDKNQQLAEALRAIGVK